MRRDGDVDCAQGCHGPKARRGCKARVEAAAGGHRRIHACEAHWQPVGGDQGGDAAAARSSISGRRVLGDVLGVDGRSVG